MEIGIMNVVFCLGGSVNFYSHVCLIWVKLDIRELHIMLLSSLEFSENWCRAGYAYVMNINKIILPYILESNPHPFYSFRGLKNQMRLESRAD
jgi:hypothetical protein